MSTQHLAAIDVGSNTVLLLIAKYDPAAGLTIVEEAEDQPRLGAGMGATSALKQESVERALGSLKRMRDLCRAHGVSRIGAVATAAVREAANGAEFVDRARGLGIPLRTISGEEEAELAFRSAAYRFPGGGRMLVADIGGGSLELIGAVEDRLELITSLPLGAVRLTGRSLPLPALRDEVQRELSQSPDAEEWKGARMIGSGGTFANLASMTLARRGESGAPIQGVEISSEETEELLRELAAMNLEQRRGVPGLRPERADIIVAGLAVAAELFRLLRASGVAINRYGLREGVLLEMLAEE